MTYYNMMNITRSNRDAAESSFVQTVSAHIQTSFINKDTHKVDNSKIISSMSKSLHTSGSEQHWGPNDGTVCDVTNDVTLPKSNIRIVDVSCENCDENQETNSNSSHQSESLSFLDGLLDLASSFSQPQKNVLQTPELNNRSFSKGSSDFVMSPPTPTLQVSPKVVVRFTDIRSGLGRAALSTSFEENRSPTDVTLRNITKMLYSPRAGPQTPRAIRRVSAGVPPTSSVARKMEFSPQTKQNKRHNRLGDVHRFQPYDGVGSSADHDALLSGSIFAEDLAGRDSFACVPKPTRNLYIPDVLLSSGNCRPDSVGFSTADVGSNHRNDYHISESWHFGMLSPSSVVTTFDIGPGTNSKTNSLSCETPVSQGAHLSHSEFYISSPPKTSSSLGFSTPCFRSGLTGFSLPSEVGLPESFAHSGSALPHISTFSHLADGQQKSCKSAFTPVVRNYNVCHSISTSRDDMQPYFTSVTSLASNDTVTSPLSVSVMPAKHDTFSPVDMPRSFTSSFLLSPPLPGLDQFCYPSTMFVSGREVQNCHDVEERDELMTPVLDQPISTPVIGEDLMMGSLSSAGHTSCSGSSSVAAYGRMPNQYSTGNVSHCTETTTSQRGPGNASGLYTYDLPFGDHHSAVENNEALQKLIKASDSLQNDIDLLHDKSGYRSLSSCGRNENDIAKTDIKDAVDAVQSPSESNDGSLWEKLELTSDVSQDSKHGPARKRGVSWSKPESVREALEKRRKHTAETCISSTANCVSIAADSCPVMARPPSHLTEPRVVLTLTKASESADVPSNCTVTQQQDIQVALSASTRRDPACNTTINNSRGLTAKNITSSLLFGQKNTLSYYANPQRNANPCGASATETNTQTTPVTCPVAGDKYNDYDLIGEPQICKTSTYNYKSHIRNPKKEMIQRQVYENSCRQVIDEATHSTAASIVYPSDSSRASDANNTSTTSPADPSRTPLTGPSDRFNTYPHSMFSHGTPSANPMYPQIMKFVREYEQFVVSNQSTMTPLQLAFATGNGGTNSADRQTIASVQSDIGIPVSNVDVATVSSTSDLAETRCYYPIFARLTDEQLGSVSTT